MYPKFIQIECSKQNDSFTLRVVDQQMSLVLYQASGAIGAFKRSWEAMLLAIEDYYDKLP